MRICKQMQELLTESAKRSDNAANVVRHYLERFECMCDPVVGTFKKMKEARVNRHPLICKTMAMWFRTSIGVECIRMKLAHPEYMWEFSAFKEILIKRHLPGKFYNRLCDDECCAEEIAKLRGNKKVKKPKRCCINYHAKEKQKELNILIEANLAPEREEEAPQPIVRPLPIRHVTFQEPPATSYFTIEDGVIKQESVTLINPERRNNFFIGFNQ
jgi:hypothetical protein